jgi:hypothetical protein
VSDAKLIIKPPHMQVRMKPGFWPDLPRMLQTIRDAGYKPIEDRVDLRVTGKLVKQAGGSGLALELEAMQTPVVLPLASGPASPDLFPKLLSKAGETVELEGRWLAPPAGRTGFGSLGVTSIVEKGGKEKPE